MTRTKLYMSAGGEVLCLGHLPRLDPTQWTAEGWQEIPDSAHDRQCEECAKGELGAPRSGPLVLNVDDRSTSLYLRERVLREHGFEVMNADSGHSARDAAHRTRPAIILLDVHLGDADGRELCEEMKADPGLGNVPVVLITATLRGQAERSESLREHGADAFLLEPVAPEELAHTLWTVLGIDS